LHDQEIGIEFLKALNRCFTPVAVGVILFGLILNPGLPRWALAACVTLVVGALTFNAVTEVYVVEHPAAWKKIGYLRVGTNLAVNSAAYCLLNRYWPIVWVLFALGPVAMAFYGDVGETFTVMGASTLVMAGCLFYQGTTDPLAWGAMVAQILFIILLSLFLIRVSGLIRRERAVERKA
jgi:hypothetical protein